MLPAASASFAPSLADPPASSVLVAAVAWLEGTLLGTVATTIAVIAIATIGFMMLSGRINIRYGATVVLGCFILFGASSIVRGIQSMGGVTAAGDAYAYRPPPPAPAPAPPPANPDPYAGPALPAR